MSNKNNSPEQKAAWEASQRLGCANYRVIPPWRYNPPKKSPSFQDRWRTLAAAKSNRRPQGGTVEMAERLKTYQRRRAVQVANSSMRRTALSRLDRQGTGFFDAEESK